MKKCVFALILSASVTLFLSQSCYAQGAKYDFAIPVMPLANGLLEFSRQIEIPVVFKSKTLGGKLGPQLVGSYTIADALEQYLKQTGVKYRFLGQKQIVFYLPEPKVTDTALVPEGSGGHDFDSGRDLALQEIVVVGETHHVLCCASSPSAATKTFTSTLKVPQSLEGIDKELFSDRGHSTLVEVFRDYSSINIMDKQGNINLRGFILPQSAILKDGQPVVSAGVTSLPIQNIDGVEVAKGANSTLYGFGEPGGVINLVTKKPREHAFTDVSVSNGNYDSYLAIDTNDRFPNSDRLLQRINLFYREERENGPVDGDTTQLQFTPAWRYDFDNGDRLDVRLEYNDQEVRGNRGRRPFDDYPEFVIPARSFFPELSEADDALELLYPGFDSSGLERDYYPVHRPSSKKHMRESTIVEFGAAFESSINDNWRYTVSAYAGAEKEESQSLVDIFILLNPAADANVESSLAILEFLLGSDFFINTHNARQDFEDQFDQRYGPPTTTNGVYPYVNEIFAGINLPVWSDDEPRFYQRVHDSESRNRRYSIEFNLVGEQFWGNVEHRLLFGANASRSTSDLTTHQRYNRELFEIGQAREASGDLSIGWGIQRYAMAAWYNPLTGEAPNGAQLPDNFARQVGLDPALEYPFNDEFLAIDVAEKRWSLGFYVQDQIRFSDQWHLRAALGWYKFSSQSRRNSLNAYTALVGLPNYLASEATPTDQAWIPSLGGVYTPTSNLSFYISASEQLTINNELGNNSRSLEPEETEVFEIGSKWWPRDNLSMTLALFQQTKTNWSVGADSIRFRSPDGKLRSRGGEVNVQGFITSHIKIAFNYALQNVESIKTVGFDEFFWERAVSGVPEDNGSIWLQYHFQPYSERGWKMGVGATYIGDRFFPHRGSRFDLGQYTLFDAMVSYHNPDYRVMLNVDNMTNEEWFVGFSTQRILNEGTRNVSQGHGARVRLTADFYF